MGNDGSLGTENGTDDEKIRPPNRNGFQREISRINGEIELLQGQAKVLLNKEGKTGSITEVRLTKEKIRAERGTLAEKAETVKKEIAQLRKQRETLRTSRLEVERECRVRSHDKLEAYLKNCMDRYNTGKLSRKEETLLVDEISDLKRNRSKLEKLTEIVKQLSATDEKINRLSGENRETYREIFKLKAEQHAKSAEQRERTVKWLHIRDCLSTIHKEKGELIRAYNQNRESYSEWIKKHRKKALASNSSYPATFPNARQRTTSMMEEEELEPFFEQKRDCQRLINYLERLKGQMETADVTVSPETLETAAVESDSDSADDFPTSFARLHVVKKPTGPAKMTDSSLKNKKPTTKKVKPAQPISHVFEIYNLFGSVDVHVPANYQDVPRALDEVRQKLVFYNHQTNIIDWYEEYRDFEDTLHPMTRSVSEYTGDSACIDSETASLASSRLHPSSPAENSSFRVPSFAAQDEGIQSGVQSKESNQGYFCHNQ